MVRKAVESDLGQILILYSFLFENENYSDASMFSEKWKTILSHDGLTYFVYEENDILTASCNIAVIPNLSRGQKSYSLIENVITHPDYRRQGYGRAVIQAAIDHAKNMNCYKVMLLSTATENRIAAHKFYESLGFNGNSKKGFNIRFY
ncbi:MAG: GNAT family N-acetyltransferase [Spirochaetes bacterium]|nr:GNAT family N-acetyltransferase [Spirochaetota bacterium]